MVFAGMEGGREAEPERNERDGGMRNELGEKKGRKLGQILLNILPATLPSYRCSTLGSVQAFRKGGAARTRATHQVLLHNDLGTE